MFLDVDQQQIHKKGVFLDSCTMFSFPKKLKPPKVMDTYHSKGSNNYKEYSRVYQRERGVDRETGRQLDRETDRQRYR